MKKPEIITKDNLLMPILATENRINEIKKELDSVSSHVILNGLFLMLVSYIESMQKAVVIYYLKYNPEELPTQKEMWEIKKDVLTDNENFGLMGHLVSEYIDKIPYRQFTDKIFYHVLKIEKPEHNLTEIIGKIKERRNELIHKNLLVDFKHKRVNGNHINHDYLIYCLNNYDKYLNHLKAEICKKYYKQTKINALMNLWHYTFRTPLCSNFGDYWHINIEKDSIHGYKEPSQESNLSHSEKFMLGIWRSQVSEGKVNFMNMASLDSDTQDHLYMFLKLANDIFLY